MRKCFGGLFITLAVTAGLVLTYVTPAVAGKPIHFIDHVVQIFCGPITNLFGSANISAGVSDVDGPFAFVEYWVAPASPENDLSTLQSAEAASVTATSDHMDAEIPLVDQNGAAAGTAFLNADLAPDGDPIQSRDRFHNGNIGFTDLSVIQPVVVTVGALEFPDGASFDLAGCTGEIDDFDFQQTDPDTVVRQAKDLVLDCALEADSATAFLFANNSSKFGSFVFLSVPTDSGELIGFADGFTFSAETIYAEIEVFDGSTGDVAGTAVLDGTFTLGDRFSYEQETSSFSEKNVGRLLIADGTLTIPTSPPTIFELSPCLGLDLRQSTIESHPSGPKPGGRVPANDTPAGATLLTPGAKLNVQTNGASADSEEPVSCTFGPGGDPALMAYTLWYTVTGTGSAITVDTAGSNFDTMIAVYTTDGSSYDEILCVDDVEQEPVGRSLQSAVTFGTGPGVTYYIQVGGLVQDQPFGRLRLHVS